MLPDSLSVMVQLESLQSTLPLSPVVRLQSLPPSQLALHESPHSPVQVLLSMQSKLQLSPHVETATLQAAPASQTQFVPVHAQASPGQELTSPSSPPQAVVASANTTADKNIRIFILNLYPSHWPS
jgi:hypothetical protein